VLCHDPTKEKPAISHTELLAFFLTQAEQLAFDAVGESQAFMLVYSGCSIRKRPNLHLHVFVVQYRWQKAWVYTVLGVKNCLLAIYNWLTSPLKKPSSNSSSERALCNQQK
jgi:hypothetical protein